MYHLINIWDPVKFDKLLQGQIVTVKDKRRVCKRNDTVCVYLLNSYTVLANVVSIESNNEVKLIIHPHHETARHDKEQVRSYSSPLPELLIA